MTEHFNNYIVLIKEPGKNLESAYLLTVTDVSITVSGPEIKLFENGVKVYKYDQYLMNESRKCTPIVQDDMLCEGGIQLYPQKDDETIDRSQLIKMIERHLHSLSNDDLAELYNSQCEQKVNYLEDDFFQIKVN